MHDAMTAADEMARKGRDKMANDPDWKLHNQDAYRVTADELRAFIERAEQLATEKHGISEQEKEVFAEAKGRGYDVKILRKIIALRKREPDDIAEEDAVLEMYMQALGEV